MIEILELKQQDEDLWTEYVQRSDHSTFYHQLMWRDVVRDVYGYKPIYLIAKEDGAVRGVLPMFYVKNLFGRRLISISFSPYGGICADDGMVREALMNYAKGLVDRGLDYLELREFGSDGKFCTFILKLNGNYEHAWRSFSKKVRNSTRKAIKLGLKFELGKEHLNEFYEVYSKNMHELGTPSHSKEFFRRVLSYDCTDLAVVKHGDAVIAGAIILKFRGTMISGWAGSDKRFLRYCPNNLLYWEMIKHACENGYRYFDFGKSLVNSGTFKFKRAWGGMQVGLSYKFYPNEMIDTSMENPKRKRFSKIWKRLPYPIVKKFSPLFRKQFP